MDHPSRGQQRFKNFERAYQQFISVTQNCDAISLSELEQDGFVQRFEYTFELAWKTLRDYLLENGYKLDSPKSVIRQAYQSGYIADGEIWMDALEKRNNTVHTYNQEILKETIRFLTEEFQPALEQLHAFLSGEFNAIRPD